MSDISFGSAYRIPITQAGVNAAKKGKLRTLIESYPNGLIGKSKTGYARVSVPDSEDANFIGKLKAIGYKVFQKFDGDNISKENLDAFIKEKLDAKEFAQKGKQAARMSREMKDQRRFERKYTPPVDRKHLDTQADMEADVQLNNLSEKINSVKPEKRQNVVDKTQTEVKENLEKVQKSIVENDKIRESAKYLEIKEKYGEEFAEAVYFGIKK